MANVDRLATELHDGLSHSLVRIRSLALVVACIAALIGIATLLTGLMVFDGSGRVPWLIIGGILCLIPTIAALIAVLYVRATAKAAPRLLDEVKSFLDSTGAAASTLIDHDSGKPLAAQAKSFAQLRSELMAKKTELPALFAGVRAITSVPGLAAVAVLGSLLIGALGTVLLIGALID